MRTNLIYLALTSVSLLAAACGDNAPPSAATVRSRIAADLPNIVGASKAAIDKSQKSIPTLPPQLGLGLGLAGMKYPLLNKLITPHAVRERSRPADGPADGPADTFDPNAEAKWLNENVFTDANQVEPGIYKVPSALACTETSSDSNGTETTALDPKCATDFDKMDLRIRVEENDETLRFAIQLDAHHDEPLAITLRHDAIGASLDLDGAEVAMTALASAAGKTAPNGSLKGQISANLEVLASSHVKASLSIDRDIAVAFADTGIALDSDQAFRFASAKSNVLAVELDGLQLTGQASLKVGATTAHLSGGDAAPSRDLDLPGATANMSFEANHPLSFTSVSLGDRTTTIKRGGRIVQSIDLNPDDRRSVGFSVTGDANGSQTAITPKLDLRLMTDHAANREPAPRFAITQYLIDGGRPVIATRASSDQLKVVSGTFAVVTNPASYGVALTAGQCAADTDVIDATSGDMYTQWMVQTCE